MSEREDQYSNCLYYASNALARMLGKMAEEEFRVLGLAPSHAFLLMTVNRQPGIQPSELSDELQLTPSTVTRLIEKMEQQGYLARNSEGRATHVTPTEKCQELDQDLRNTWQNLIDRYREILGDRYTEVLTEMTYTATERLNE